MNIILPLLIYPRSYSLSYLSSINENDSKQSNLFLKNFSLPIQKRKLCLQVQIHSNEEKINLNRILSINHHLNEEEEEDNSSNDTTHAVISDSINNSDHSFDTNVHIHSSTLEMRNDFSQTDLRAIESSHIISLTDNNRFIIQIH
jgi:outer membrane usher protein FimD/PapC